MLHRIGLSTFSTDTTRQLNIFGHDGNPLGVDCTQIGVLKQTNQIRLSSFLKSKNGVALEPQISLSNTKPKHSQFQENIKKGESTNNLSF